MSLHDFSEDIAKLKNIKPRNVAPERYSEKRPWGGYDQFAENELCTVKILTIMPGEAISEQAHNKRSEYWVVLDAKMDVELNGDRQTLYRGHDIFVPAGTHHRVYGLDAPCRWLEIAFGVHDEHDIHRFKDKYGRAR